MARMLKRADEYYTAGEYAKAKVEYDNVLRADPKNALANERVGMMWFDQGAALSAVPFLLKAREADGKNVAIQNKLGLVYLALGRVREAKMEALELLKQSSGQDDGILILIETIRSVDDFNYARDELRKLPTLKPVTFNLATAALALRRGEFANAQRALERALAEEPKSEPAHSAMATFLLIQNKRTEAEKELKVAADLAPVRSLAKLKYAQFKLQAGAIAEAKAYITDITKQAPDYLPGWTALAQMSLAEKKYDEAQGLLDKAFTRDPSNYDAHVLRAQIWMAQGDLPKAIEHLEKIGENYRGLAQDKFHLARAYSQNKQADKAVAAARLAVLANPENEAATVLLLELEIRAGHSQEVLPILVDLLIRRPNQVAVQTLLTAALQSLPDLATAEPIVRERLTAAPRSAEPPFLLGVILMRQNKFAEARTLLDKALELAPDRIDIVTQRVDLDLREKNVTAALRRAQEQIAKKPNSPDVRFLEARIYGAQGKWNEAEASLQKALEIDPNYSNAYNFLLYSYMVNKKQPQALAQLEETIQKQPDNTRALVLTGMIQGQMAQYPKARDAYEKVVAKDPKASLAMNNLAMIYADQLNNLDRALELAQAAYKLEPEAPAVEDTLGWILVKRKDYPKALEHLTAAATKLGDNPEVQFHFGVINQLLGKKDEAREALRKAVDSPTDFPGKAEARQRLNELGGAPAATKKA